MAAPAEPWGQVLTALWEVLESRESFTSLVKPGNRIRFDNRIRKSTLQAADVPAVAVVAGALDPNVARSSNGMWFKRQFSFKIYTGELDITEQLFPVEWELILAATTIQKSLGDLDFIQSIQLSQGAGPGADPDGKSSGWYDVVNLDVTIRFDTASLQS